MFPSLNAFIVLYPLYSVLTEDLGIKVECRPVPEEELETFEEAGHDRMSGGGKSNPGRATGRHPVFASASGL